MKSKPFCHLFVFAFLLLAGSDAFAYAPDVDGVTVIESDEAFGDLLGLVVGFATGALGKTVAVLAFLVGLVMGVVRQSIMGFLIGAAFAVVLGFGPSLLIRIFGAAFPFEAFAALPLA